MIKTDFLDPVNFPGDGQYNLNILKETDVTDSFLGLDQDVRNCQNVETYDDCTTRLLLDQMRDDCGCLPLSLIGNDKVIIKRNTKLVVNKNKPREHGTFF